MDNDVEFRRLQTENSILRNQTVTDVKHLYDLALAVRKAQKLYFKTRNKEDLIASKRLETALDSFLASHNGKMGMEE